MRYLFLRNLSLAFVLTALAASAAIPSERVGEISGSVIDAHGRPIAGASVTIQTSDGQHPHATRTDASGQFHFVRFEVGQYDLRGYGRGTYSDWAKRVLIRWGKVTHVTLRIAAR